jgi:hypothetical protein
MGRLIDAVWKPFKFVRSQLWLFHGNAPSFAYTIMLQIQVSQVQFRGTKFNYGLAARLPCVYGIAPDGLIGNRISQASFVAVYQWIGCRLTVNGISYYLSG